MAVGRYTQRTLTICYHVITHSVVLTSSFEHKCLMGTWEQSASCQKPTRFDLRASKMLWRGGGGGGECPQSPHPPAKILYETLQWQYTNNSPVGSTLLLIWYVTVSSAPELATILTEWFPGGLTSLFSTRGRVPVEEMNAFHKYHEKI